jgi:hypothetical protein
MISSVSKVLTVSLIVLVASILASDWSQRRQMISPRYDVATETAMKGLVDEAKETRGQGGWIGVHLILKSDAVTIDVHIGPSDFVAKQGFTFAKGDQIEVTGSRVKIDGADVLIAREVTKDGKVLKLRDAKGFPVWSRGNRE